MVVVVVVVVVDWLAPLGHKGLQAHKVYLVYLVYLVPLVSPLPPHRRTPVSQRVVRKLSRWTWMRGVQEVQGVQEVGVQGVLA